ncbi:hypothetical protein EZV61_14265 [Corallincola luteus]|uniref:DUF218 domain-containing protein n=1 Tax=Corallincola luteus TaxID=1775177 RepID=A0ABY2AIM1_9GAMM|nr:ElyC/SanA/YdcF family protein [Corallincola luteus]TCI02514.1 hypothetical protein EZV61_14265 [Corallincola luteus]
MFILKKLAAAWISPLPIIFLLCLVALIMAIKSGSHRIVTSLLAITLLLIVFTSIPPAGDYQIAAVEKEYPAVLSLPEDTKYIVVLGCGHQSLPIDVISARLYECALKRVTEGLRHFYQKPNRIMIFTGYGGAEYTASAIVMRDVAISLGLPAQNAVVLPSPRDTSEEAIATASFIKQAPFALVTSASHLPRAVNLFKRQGLDPYPVPADIRGTPDKPRDWWYYRPDSDQIRKTRQAWYEYMGRLWVWLGGH